MPRDLARRWRWVSPKEIATGYSRDLSPTRQADVGLAQKAVMVSFSAPRHDSIFPSVCHTPPNLLLLVCAPWLRPWPAVNSVVAGKGGGRL